jgi:hypothetical protein
VILPNRFCEIDAFERLEDVVVSLLHIATAEREKNSTCVFCIVRFSEKEKDLEIDHISGIDGRLC